MSQKKLRSYFDRLRHSAKQNHTFIRNFSYLSILQVFSLILPLVTYPYLIDVLGKETYGLVVYAQAIVGYLVIFVGYGFNISATKQISVNRHNKGKLDEIVSNIITLKSFFFLASSVILITLIVILPQANGYEVLFLLMLWMCLYDVIFPIWYFQGIEQMRYITFITLISRIIFVGLIFAIIHTPKDYLLIPIINGIGALIGGALSLHIVFKKHNVKFTLPTISQLKFYLSDSTPIFLSNVSIKLYVSTNKVVVGTFLGMGEVAYYDLAEKLVNVLKMPIGILSQALFPKVSLEKNIHFVRKLFNLSLGINVLIYFTFILLSKYIVLLLGGETMTNAIFIVNLLALTLPIIAMSNLLGIQLLIPFGHNKTFSSIVVASGLVYLAQAIFIWGLWEFSLLNITLMTVITELFVTVTMFYYCKKYKLWI